MSGIFLAMTANVEIVEWFFGEFSRMLHCVRNKSQAISLVLNIFCIYFSMCLAFIHLWGFTFFSYPSLSCNGFCCFIQFLGPPRNYSWNFSLWLPHPVSAPRRQISMKNNIAMLENCMILSSIMYKKGELFLP